MDKLKCAFCKPKHCSQGITDESLLPSFCPMKDVKGLIQEVTKKYSKEDIQHFYINSALTEKEAYDEKAAREEEKVVPVRPRIREIAEFANKMKFKKLGMAFCSGLPDEASRASSILEKHGLEVCSIICSCGAIDKTKMGVPPEYKIRDPKKFEAACNPILQAELLNKAGTNINVLIGLCVGHDMLFTMNSEAPVTTLIVKDRLTGHNPVISLYSRYYRDIV
ncbi:MAG: DUF1847 domain-containing protein [Candidatus Aminicenantes bacterium]|nr:MAG: DUF1847 domain-containing protein [Candidatus Aminicenantes bacterium]